MARPTSKRFGSSPTRAALFEASGRLREHGGAVEQCLVSALPGGAVAMISAGSVTSTPGTDPRLGLVYNAKVGRHNVKFVLVIVGGPPRTVSVWRPERPKRLKPRLLQRYRAERRTFAVLLSKRFRSGFHVVDRMDPDGRPRVTEIVRDGVVETLAPPVAYFEPVLH